MLPDGSRSRFSFANEGRTNDMSENSDYINFYFLDNQF